MEYVSEENATTLMDDASEGSATTQMEDASVAG